LKPGFAARGAALGWIQAVTGEKKPLDEAMDHDGTGLEPRDRAFAHALAATVLRRQGEIDAALSRFLNKPLPRSSGPAVDILRLGVAQLLYLKGDAHAAIDLSVELAKANSKATHFSGLINAVLRKVARAPEPAGEAYRNLPPWLWAELTAAFGPETAFAIADANMREAALDVSVKSDPAKWADMLGGVALPTGSVRIEKREAALTELPGFRDGAWWVQDAAAALPVKLFGDVDDRTILDLCAAPGGKTAQLASLGADVTAVDDSPLRMQRMLENLDRLGLKARFLVTDVMNLPEDSLYDGVLLDAPCSATGTMRRHPDLAHLRTEKQMNDVRRLQSRMLRHAARLVKPGGFLVYCVCSFLPSEGEVQIERFLAAQPDFKPVPVASDEIGGVEHFITPAGFLRTLPHMAIGPSSGLDGFFAARLRRH
jgi:16S rRNA (cytosine967-C5)-methyltransferase